MDGLIRYLNTDLDLTSPDDLTPLAAALDGAGVFPLQVALEEDALWYATFETAEEYAEPAQNIAAMLAVVETLSQSLRRVWEECTRGEFNIGYDCGIEPWAFNQALSAEVLGRMADAGATLRVTLYPEREQKQILPSPPTPDGNRPAGTL